ncbi:Two-component response regulator ARR11 [Acorus gramineus]|uniref:Two-component response regulator ARR11 n=1 Tax=Acorus gramineus TaxID=55184 RepID=A0AAV9BRV4_ACOGR|nr:Two-component response regulator ARR11 [Acorus gramineus]
MENSHSATTRVLVIDSDRDVANKLREFKYKDSHSATTRVLVIDSDCDVANKLREFKYKVTTCLKAEYALKLVQDMDVKFDIVMIDAFMSDMDSFELLERISNDVNVSIIKEQLKYIWKHTIRKSVKIETSENIEEGNAVLTRIMNYKNYITNDEDDLKLRDESLTTKKRFHWKPPFHRRFVDVVTELGDGACPKEILARMNVPYLTRENVASHLQKYRLYLKRQAKEENKGNDHNSSPNAVDKTERQNGVHQSFDLQIFPMPNQSHSALVHRLMHGPPQGVTSTLCSDTSGMQAETQPAINNQQMNNIYHEQPIMLSSTWPPSSMPRCGDSLYYSAGCSPMTDYSSNNSTDIHNVVPVSMHQLTIPDQMTDANNFKAPSENTQVFNVSQSDGFQISGPNKDENNTTQCVEDNLSPIFTMDMDMLESLFRKVDEQNETREGLPSKFQQ